MNLVGHFRIRALLSLIEKKKEKARIFVKYYRQEICAGNLTRQKEK